MYPHIVTSYCQCTHMLLPPSVSLPTYVNTDLLLQPQRVPLTKRIHSNNYSRCADHQLAAKVDFGDLLSMRNWTVIMQCRTVQSLLDTGCGGHKGTIRGSMSPPPLPPLPVMYKLLLNGAVCTETCRSYGWVPRMMSRIFHEHRKTTSWFRWTLNIVLTSLFRWTLNILLTSLFRWTLNILLTSLFRSSRNIWLTSLFRS